jgi:hypothetical protein
VERNINFASKPLRLLIRREPKSVRTPSYILGKKTGPPIGPARPEAACVRALAHASPAYCTVKSILVGGFDNPPLHRHDLDGQSVYGRTARFARDARTLFDIDAETRHCGLGREVSAEE